MNTTRLFPWHKAKGARFAPFAGYDMPLNYPTGAVEEHRLTRRSAGLFDIDHMGQVRIDGPGAGEALSRLVSSRILDMRAGEARYALLLAGNGGVLDDLFIYRLAPEAGIDPWFVVVNASNREQDVQRFRSLLPVSVEVRDLSDETYMIALQGPRAVELMDRCTLGAVSSLPRFSMAEVPVAGIPARIGRTGYTGEDGVEIFYPSQKALELWEKLLFEAEQAGIEAGPVGLAARDSLRFEAGMPLHGHEISPSIKAPEALLSWACDLEKDFIGKDVVLELKKKGLTRKLVTLNVQGGVPREGYTVHNHEGKEIGLCVAGMFCPTTGTYSANAFVPPEYAGVDTELFVSIRGIAKKAVVARRPLYKPTYRR